MARIIAQHERRGTMLVEAAIVLPVLMLLTMGLMEYGWIYLKSEEIANAARHGARVGIRIDSTIGEVEAEVNDLMSRAGIAGYTVTSSADPSALETGQILTVTVTAPYEGGSLALLDVPFVPVPTQLSYSVSMAKEGT